MARQREYDKRMAHNSLLDPAGPPMFAEHQRVVAEIDLLPVASGGRAAPTAAPARTPQGTDAAPIAGDTGQRLPPVS